MSALAFVASEAHTTALEVFTAIPGWAQAHAVHNKDSAPLFRRGEVAVYKDAPKTFPRDGELYVVQYGGYPVGVTLSDGPVLSPLRQALMQARRRTLRDGEDIWWFQTYAGPIHWSDGPYDDPTSMAPKVLGPVVGIYAPSGSAAI